MVLVGDLVKGFVRNLCGDLDVGKLSSGQVLQVDLRQPVHLPHDHGKNPRSHPLGPTFFGKSTHWTSLTTVTSYKHVSTQPTSANGINVYVSEHIRIA